MGGLFVRQSLIQEDWGSIINIKYGYIKFWKSINLSILNMSEEWYRFLPRSMHSKKLIYQHLFPYHPFFAYFILHLLSPGSCRSPSSHLLSGIIPPFMAYSILSTLNQNELELFQHFEEYIFSSK